MRSFISISLSKYNKKLIKNIIKGILPRFKCIRITKDSIILRTWLFGSKTVVNTQDFLTTIIPKELEKLANLKGIDLNFRSFSNSVEFIFFVESQNETDLIGYLGKVYSQIMCTNDTSNDYVDHSQKAIPLVCNTNTLSDTIIIAVVKSIMDSIRSIEHLSFKVSNYTNNLRIVHRNAEIRGSPTLTTAHNTELLNAG